MIQEEARNVAYELLAETLPSRWKHVCIVGSRAEGYGALLGADGDTLITSAWLHDVGYSPTLRSTGFHPLDGARYLRDIGVPGRIVGLVACHSSAAAEAETLGVAGDLAQFEDERTVTRDLLWYLDMTTGPDGQVVSFRDRMAEVRERYPSDHYVVRALDVGMAERVAAVERAEAWLSSVGLVGQV